MPGMAPEEVLAELLAAGSPEAAAAKLQEMGYELMPTAGGMGELDGELPMGDEPPADAEPDFQLGGGTNQTSGIDEEPEDDDEAMSGGGPPGILAMRKKAVDKAMPDEEEA